MGCSQASAHACPQKVEARPEDVIPAQSSNNVTPNTDGLSVLRVKDRVVLECDEPTRADSFHSWNHEVDRDDMRMIFAGHSVPINKTVHNASLKAMTQELKELMKDPCALKRLVKERRAGCEREMACANTAACTSSSHAQERVMAKGSAATSIRPGHSFQKPASLPISKGPSTASVVSF